ncbi:hypothetical protein [Alteromonas sp. a30]|uniref:hypothetical protein n=1 Tax=Alteromonas sp. a30 TaxID=2730917 RepID=UPI0022824880|nr:hypothetical protein [Alteromonas sp. a30]MCY7294895.1 hypothetical protein [Alteromonas sp. a30]
MWFAALGSPFFCPETAALWANDCMGETPMMKIKRKAEKAKKGRAVERITKHPWLEVVGG